MLQLSESFSRGQSIQLRGTHTLKKKKKSLFRFHFKTIELFYCQKVKHLIPSCEKKRESFYLQIKFITSCFFLPFDETSEKQ